MRILIVGLGVQGQKRKKLLNKKFFYASVDIDNKKADFQSIKAMFINEVGGAYKILEIQKSATDNQVKKAYRNLAKKHHPDKIQHLGDAYVKAAQEKFQKVQKAYERIKQERGF